MAGKKRSIPMSDDMCDVQKEWDDALCPICMEHPHNAVLLLCTSHAKGCRSYVCDTSYRHSNCLDRFKKLNSESSNNSLESSSFPSTIQGSDVASTQSTSLFGNDLPLLQETQNGHEEFRQFIDSHYSIQREAEERPVSELLMDRSEQGEISKKSSLKCPLCRGDVLAWTVVEDARNDLNLKRRSCTRESCTFAGNYRELRRHARSVHPRVRPAEVDLTRQRAWRTFEHEREHEDIVSAIRSAIPGAVVFGDYVIENGGDRLPPERERTSGEGNRSWLPTLLFIQMLDSVQSMAAPRSRPWRTRHRRLQGGPSRQRYLWGENLLGLQDEDGDGDDSYTEEEETNVIATNVGERGSSSAPRQRRRLSQSRSRRVRF